MAVSLSNVSLEHTLSYYGLSKEQLSVPCSESLCNNCAAKLSRWELLAPHIGLNEGDIVEIREDCRTYQEQRLGSLRKWRSKFGNVATVLFLAEALFKIKRLDLVGELCRMYWTTQREQQEATDLACPQEVTVEYKRLLSCKEQMISEFSCDLQTLSRKLSEKNLIPPSLEARSNYYNTQDDIDKATEIVECLLKKVHSFPEKYNMLIGILSECSWMDDLVALLSNTSDGTSPESPEADNSDRFPYLKDSSLSDEERSDLTAELEYRSKQISRKFQVLVARTGRALKQANCTVNELRTLFAKEDRILKALRKTQDMDKAMFKLSKMSSFVDYELLEIMVEGYCQDQELRDDLSAYVDDLKVYCQRRVCEVPVDAFTSKKYFKSKGPYLSVKVDKNWKITLNQVKDLEKQISDILWIKLHLVMVKDGCIELVFNPLTTLCRPLSQQQKKQLRDAGVVRLYVGEKEFSLIDSDSGLQEAEIPFSCFMCEEYESTYEDVMNSHAPVCKCRPVECPNSCGADNLQHQHLENHVTSQCPLTYVECGFSDAGCDAKVQRKDLASHMISTHKWEDRAGPGGLGPTIEEVD